MIFQSKVKVVDYWKLRWCNLSSKCLCNLGYKESNIVSMGVSSRLSYRRKITWESSFNNILEIVALFFGKRKTGKGKCSKVYIKNKESVNKSK